MNRDDGVSLRVVAACYLPFRPEAFHGRQLMALVARCSAAGELRRAVSELRTTRFHRIGDCGSMPAQGPLRALVLSCAVWCSVSAFSFAPTRMTMIESHIHVMKPIDAPSDPYVLSKLPKLAAYHEKSADAASQATAAKALPQVIQRQRASFRLGP
jgi:hypothetical protein